MDVTTKSVTQDEHLWLRFPPHKMSSEAQPKPKLMFFFHYTTFI